MQVVFQDPYSSLNPAPPGRVDRRGAAAGPPDREQARALGARRRGPAAGRARPVAREPLPAPVLGRPAPADRDRPGDRDQPAAGRRRRAGVRARRVDPGAGAQPDRRPARRVPARAALHLARRLGRPARERPDRGHVPRQDRRGRADRRALRASARTRTRRRCSRRCRRRGRAGRARADPGDGRAAEPARTRRAAAASGRDARSRSRSAPRSSRRSSGTAGHSSRVTSRSTAA